ncbi:uncharacterized protein LOC134222173 [Armigeres subalbatus]|uniref:uncharacterized protein LOC134222173 n=1 Tax=Armigeres subalbatus TaxID=124917 RepID=UPI002ED3AD61
MSSFELGLNQSVVLTDHPSTNCRVATSPEESESYRFTWDCFTSPQSSQEDNWWQTLNKIASIPTQAKAHLAIHHNKRGRQHSNHPPYSHSETDTELETGFQSPRTRAQAVQIKKNHQAAKALERGPFISVSIAASHLPPNHASSNHANDTGTTVA